MTELRKLIEAVEASGIALSDLDPFVRVLDMTSKANDAHMAYRGSLDAAKALHEELLNDDWHIDQFSLNGEVVLRRSNPASSHYGFAEMNPARAWLIAVLKAYEDKK